MNNRTELVFILDRSGSMSGLEADTIGGFNSMLSKQKKEAGQANVTTVLFDDRYELLHDRIDIQGVAPITDREYFVRGSTALLDAIGITVDKLDHVQTHTAPDYRADKVLFVITTDGMENSSRKFTHMQIKKLIEAKKEMGWEFLFLGANIDAVATAKCFGISADRAVNYHADREGTALNYEVLSETVASFRASKPIAASWKAKIEKDYKSRRSTR